MATRRLSIGARAFRAAHSAIALAFLVAIGYVWWCALTGRRDQRLTEITLLFLEWFDRAVGQLQVVVASRGGELVDREVFVVTNEHLPLDASEHLGVLARQRAPCRRVLVAPVDAWFAVPYE